MTDLTAEGHAVVRAGANVTHGAQGVLDTIDNFDRDGSASATGTYSGSGNFSNGFENKTGRRIPKAGVYTAAGVGLVRAEWSVFDAEAKGPNASAGAGVSLLGAKAMAKAEIASASASAGPVKATVGLSADTGVGIGVDGLEAKFLGTGFKIGPTVNISLFGSGVEFNLW